MSFRFARITLALAAASVLSAPALADDPMDGQLTTVNARYVFAPIGFDDNDETEVVVDGYLPSGCYRLAQPEIVVDKALKRVTITPKARYFDVPCIEALVPYFFTASLGQLADGNYAVEVAGIDATLTEALPVKHAIGPSPDDYTYAPVDEVKVTRDQATGKLTATLRGRLTSSCMVWKEARVFDNGKTINILPILSLDATGDCNNVEKTYEKVIDLPDTITRGRHLLHVRSLNGQAVNHLFFK